MNYREHFRSAALGAAALGSAYLFIIACKNGLNTKVATFVASTMLASVLSGCAIAAVSIYNKKQAAAAVTAPAQQPR